MIEEEIEPHGPVGELAEARIDRDDLLERQWAVQSLAALAERGRDALDRALLGVEDLLVVRRRVDEHDHLRLVWRAPRWPGLAEQHLPERPRQAGHVVAEVGAREGVDE